MLFGESVQQWHYYGFAGNIEQYAFTLNIGQGSILNEIA